ncbi:hypothetical protein AHAS_Ahas11G0169300 [Arachis hypogaea]
MRESGSPMRRGVVFHYAVTINPRPPPRGFRRWEGISSLLPSEEAAATVCTELRSVARIKGRSRCFATASGF